MRDKNLPVFVQADTQLDYTTKTAHLRLRPLSLDDGDNIFDLGRKSTSSSWPAPSAREECESWVHERLANGISNIHCVEVPIAEWGNSTERIEFHRVIGLIGSKTLPQIGYWFDPDYRGKGYLDEALKAWVPLFWQHHPEEDTRIDLERPHLEYWAQQTPYGGYAGFSRDTLRKIGFIGYIGKEVEIDGKKVVRDVWVIKRPTKYMFGLKVSPTGALIV